MHCFAPYIKVALLAGGLPLLCSCEPADNTFINSLGMKMLPIPAGSFIMGETNDTPAEAFAQGTHLKRGDWDEHPAHRVTISHPFYISEVEVTTEQFKQFRSTYIGNPDTQPYASGVSWHDAAAFCHWLTKREGKPYRLPTEAEWEYACRAGTTTLFSSGSEPPSSETANAWGVKNMHTGVGEWCLDWHGEYSFDAQTDPVGPASGVARVIRGGGLDRETTFYARSANRAGLPPDFPPCPLEELQIVSRAANAGKRPANSGDDPERHAFRKTPNRHGQGRTGFRIVLAPPPESAPTPAVTPLTSSAVVQSSANATIAPDPARPYFRKRLLLPTPPENVRPSELVTFRALGWPRAFLRHQHSPALIACDNGDLLAVFFSASAEHDPEVALMGLRLRFGADQWDPPDLFLDISDVNDHAPMLWNDTGRLWFFWGFNNYAVGFPFQWMVSDDHGATWGTINFPGLPDPVGPHSAQPVTNTFHDRHGVINVACDGRGSVSLLWRSADNGVTWADPGGRTGGRHTAFVELRDGRILGMGGKSSNIEGYMPRSISSDGGKTWTVSKTPFPALGSNQRPSLIRLASGRLLFACDLQSDKGKAPASIEKRGALVALSDDEGETWATRVLPGVQLHERPERATAMGGGTLGYSVARQAPNGMIHLITSMNQPCLHFEFNEAWVLQYDVTAPVSDAELLRSTASYVPVVKEYTETDEVGRVRLHYSGGIADDGRFLLHGKFQSFYADGTPEFEANYALGALSGRQSLGLPGGILSWTREYKPDGSMEWTNYWPDGSIRTR